MKDVAGRGSGGVWWCVCLLAAASSASESAASGSGDDEVRILNWRRWGPLAADAPLLLVLSDGRGLHALLHSVCAARGVHAALLVVSHARPDPPAQRLVRSLRCCAVAQVVFPHGDQVAAMHADKLHWWWSMRWVMEAAPWASARRGPVLVLRGGQLVAEDALHVLRRALTLPVHAVALGRPAAAARRHKPYDLVALSAWRASFGTGLALSGRTWRAVRRHTRVYCSTGVRSWSGALEAALAATWGRGGALMAAVAAPRVLRAAEGGSRRALQGARRDGRMFPARMRAVHVWGRAGRVHGVNASLKTAAETGTAKGRELQSEARRLCEGALLFNHSLTNLMQ